MTGYVSALGSEYDAFLYAPLYRDEHEMTLSVVSVLVRVDVDPWQEAARLARLPKKAATTRLASLIAKTPGGFPVQLDAKAIAARLVGLLPSPALPKLPPVKLTVPSIGKVGHPRTILFVILLLAVLGVQYLANGRSGDPGPAAGSTSTRQ